MESSDARLSFHWTLLSPVAELDILQYFTFFSIPFIPPPPQCFHGNGNQALDHYGTSQQVPISMRCESVAQGIPQNALE